MGGLDFDPWSLADKSKIRIPTPEGGFTAYVYHVQKILPPSEVLGRDEKWKQYEKSTSNKHKRLDRAKSFTKKRCNSKPRPERARPKSSSYQNRSNKQRGSLSRQKQSENFEPVSVITSGASEERRKSHKNIKLKSQKRDVQRTASAPLNSQQISMPPTVNKLERSSTERRF